MSRAGAADIVTVKPTNNVYTVLVFAAFLIAAGAFVAMFLKANVLFGPGGLWGSGT